MSSTSKSFIYAIAIVVGLLICLLAALAALNRRDEVAGFNQEIRYDDSAFSVLAMRKTEALGTLHPQGVYYVVTLKVTNHAKRVDYEFKADSPVLVGSDGRQYRVSSDAQRMLVSQNGGHDSCAAPIPPGTACTKEVAFDAPADLDNPRLKFSEGGLAGDILDTIFYGKKFIKLEQGGQQGLAQ